MWKAAPRGFGRSTGRIVTVAWLVGQSLVIIVAAFLLGVLVGYLIWGVRRPGPAPEAPPAAEAAPAPVPLVVTTTVAALDAPTETHRTVHPLVDSPLADAAPVADTAADGGTYEHAGPDSNGDLGSGTAADRGHRPAADDGAGHPGADGAGARSARAAARCGDEQPDCAGAALRHGRDGTV